MNDAITKSVQIAYGEEKDTGMPLLKHIDLSREVGLNLAEKLGADKDVVEIGTLMMGCMIGKALQEDRLAEHVEMSLNRTDQMLEEIDIADETKENIRHCVSEHHGVDNYFSLESEICANADCYRFVSIRGFMYATRFLRDMEFENLISLLSNKVDEKWNVLSLDVCKEELEPQYETILKILNEVSIES